MQQLSDTNSNSAAGPIAVIGAGSWGTALAVLLAQQGHSVRLWGRNADAISEMASVRENLRYLPNIELPQSLLPTADLRAAVCDVDDVLVVVPSHAFAQCVAALAKIRPGLPALAWATKGFEPETGRFLDDIVRAGDFSNAFETRWSESEIQYAVRFAATLDRKYKSRLMLFQSGPLFSMMAVLVLFLYLRIYIRNRRRMKRLDEMDHAD